MRKNIIVLSPKSYYKMNEDFSNSFEDDVEDYAEVFSNSDKDTYLRKLINTWLTIYNFDSEKCTWTINDDYTIDSSSYKIFRNGGEGLREDHETLKTIELYNLCKSMFPDHPELLLDIRDYDQVYDCVRLPDYIKFNNVTNFSAEGCYLQSPVGLPKRSENIFLNENPDILKLLPIDRRINPDYIWDADGKNQSLIYHLNYKDYDYWNIYFTDEEGNTYDWYNAIHGAIDESQYHPSWGWI